MTNSELKARLLLMGAAYKNVGMWYSYSFDKNSTSFYQHTDKKHWEIDHSDTVYTASDIWKIITGLIKND